MRQSGIQLAELQKKSDKRTDTPTNILQKLISQPWETKLYLTNLYLMNF